jgi:large subunit ribosomal protein L10
MNREEKAAAIAEIAGEIQESQAVIAVDPSGLTVAQSAEIRGQLRGANATLRIVKNTLTERAADEAGVAELKALLTGPTALAFVRGDAAAAAKAISDYGRTTERLAFKGGYMDGAALDVAQITAIAKLPSRDVLYGQLVAMVASPITGLARGLNALLSGVAIALGQVQAKAEAGEIQLGAGSPAPAATEPEPEAAAEEAPATEAAADPEAAPATDTDSGDQDADAPEPATTTEDPAEGPDDTTSNNEESQ